MGVGGSEIKTVGIQEPVVSNSFIDLTIKESSSHLVQAVVTISSDIFNQVKFYITEFHSKYSRPQGLESIDLPFNYIEKENREKIESSIKKFILKYIVFDFMAMQIPNKRVSLANGPRIASIVLEDDNTLKYYFDLSMASQLSMKDWKLFSFKAPKRKQYKDLDKQVDLFIKSENSIYKKQNFELIENYDWVNFAAVLLDDKNVGVIPDYESNFWLRINIDEIEEPFQKNFVGKKLGDSFTITGFPLVGEIRDLISEQSKFSINIKSIVKGMELDQETFKSFFKLKTKSNLHSKMIEVFSYRNDVSQRKAIIEEVFHLLFSKHRFEIPKHFVICHEVSRPVLIPIPQKFCLLRIW